MSDSRIAIFGAGYAGLVTGACFAELGHSVVIRDIVPEKISVLQNGTVPIYEPGLEELIERNRERLRYTLDAGEAVRDAEFIFVCVDTPPTYSGDADLSRVQAVVSFFGPTDLTAALAIPSSLALDVADPVPSPDGHQIAFVSQDQVWLMNADGTRPTALTRFDSSSFPFSCRTPEWTRL